MVLEGVATMLLGDPAERVEVPRGTVALVDRALSLQLRNESGAEVVILAVGGPPVQGKAEHLPDVD